jgi:hypothetical protein
VALTDFAQYNRRLSNPDLLLPFTVASTVTIAGRPQDLWTAVSPVGVAPTTAVVPTNATAGSFDQINPTSGEIGMVGARINALNPGVYLLCDRLSHQGGLSGTVGATGQTTNLPTAALTRYTDGVGVMAGLTIYTQIGTTATVVGASYTNTTPTAGRSGPLVVFGGTGFREAGRMILLPLVAGDTGVRSVQFVTVVASTGTTGNFGVTLFKPLYAVIVDTVNGVTIADLVTGNTGGGLPKIEDDACLFLMCISGGVNALASGTALVGEW